jgi:phospholipid/cholesterol/gamma-HCH transport system substrate-binding protein
MALTQSRKNEITVGVFVLLSFVGLFCLTFVIQGSTGMDPYRLRTQYPNVSGLEIGSPVLVQGFRTGRVVEMTPGSTINGKSTVIVVCEIARTIPIYKNATVNLVQQGFIGDKRLEVDPGTKDAGEVLKDDLIKGIPPSDLNELFKKGEQMMEDLSVTLANVREITSDKERLKKIDDTIANINKSSSELKAIIEENRANVNTTVTNVKDLTEKGNAIAERTDRILNDAETVVADFKKNAQQVTEKVDKILAKADEAGTNANELLTSSKKEVEELSDSLQATSKSLNDLLGDLNAGKGTVGMLLKDPRPFEDLQQSVAALRRVLLEEQNDYYDRRIPYRGGAADKPGGATTDGAP